MTNKEIREKIDSLKGSYLDCEYWDDYSAACRRQKEIKAEIAELERKLAE